MTESGLPSHRVAIVGGGIAGLAAAHRLTELDPASDVVVLEAGDRPGGLLQTVRREGYLLERGADSFQATAGLPWASDLCRRLEIADDLIETNPACRRAFVVGRGKLVPIPEGFVVMVPRRLRGVLATPLLSTRGKLRVAAERLVPARRTGPEESVARFARRRLGREAYERLVQPLVGGIYTADLEKLSVEAALPQMAELERNYGSLSRGARRQERGQDESGARYSRFVTPRSGLSQLVEALVARLAVDRVRTRSRVEVIRRAGSGWALDLADGDPVTCDRLVVATPAPAAAGLLRKADEGLADELGQIEQAGASIVSLGIAREQIGHPLDGFGVVVPAIEGRRILACAFSSVKFPGRAPAGRVLLRAFVGGALQPELADLPDDELTALVEGELAHLIGLRGRPELVDVARWPRAMPQYHLGHADRVSRIEARVAALRGLELAGNAYRGVGIPQCIHSGEQAAERLLS